MSDSRHPLYGDRDAAVPAFPTQAVRCPRCDVEHSPGYPHATGGDCNAALVGTLLMDLTAERDRLREALEQVWLILLTNADQARERAYRTADEALHV